MLATCWSVKGGVGTSVVAGALAVLLSRRHPAGALLVDADGDQPAILGLPPSAGPGLAELTAQTPVEAATRLQRLEQPVDDLLALVPRGDGALRVDALVDVADALLLDARPTVVDAGVLDANHEDRSPLVHRATTSLLVVRPCYLCLRRATASALRPTGVVVIDEVDRTLDASDVEDVLGVPVLACIPDDAAVARAVDAGTLARHLPRRLARSLASVG